MCNGSTTDSDSVCWGSNPYSAAKIKNAIHRMVFFVFDWIERDSNGQVVNDCQWQSEPALTEPAGETEALFGSQRKRVSHSGCPFCFVEIERDSNRVAERNLAPRPQPRPNPYSAAR